LQDFETLYIGGAEPAVARRTFVGDEPDQDDVRLRRRHHEEDDTRNKNYVEDLGHDPEK
jgi:hypothetical protein